MRFAHVLAALATFAALGVPSYGKDVPARRAEILSSNGLTDAVQWDGYSLFVKGQRVFIYSGEFHTFRLPVPGLWKDILQKIKAAGFNGVSIYLHWGLINPSPGVIDLEGFRALQPFFDAAKDAGLWVIYRPGPYINAETSAGGIPHWVTTEVAGHLRTNATDYRAAWEPYIKAVAAAARGNQITEGGPVIAIQLDNEYVQPENMGNPGKDAYMHELGVAVRAAGIVVPTTYNDAYQGGNFVSGLGKVDLYGLDSYSNGFDCRNPDVWQPVITNYYEYLTNINPGHPLFVPEFQSGSLDPWGPAPGYDGCWRLTGPDYLSVFNSNLWANDIKLINFYMFYGGTSWGNIPFHKVYTSYDNGASIRESRELSEKYTEMKKQGYFLRSAPEFYKTDLLGNSTSGAVTVDNPAAFVSYLRNPDTGASFYIARQTNSTSKQNIEFTVSVKTSIRPVDLPVALSGRQSKVIVTDLTFGTSRVLFSTAQIFFAGQLGGRDVLFVYVDVGGLHQLAVSLKSSPADLQINGGAGVTVSTGPTGYAHIDYSPTQKGITTLSDSSTLIVLSDSETAGTFWAPVLPANQNTQFANYWQIGTNSSVLIGGPYLVRSASLKGSRLEITGDTSGSTEITIIGAPPSVTSVTWNGQRISTTSINGLDAVVTGNLNGADVRSGIRLPSLGPWKYADSLPEIKTSYDDALWKTADRKETNSPFKPYYGDGRVLYGCDYGFCEGAVLWRGHFKATGSEKAVNLSINGGEAFAASVFLNGKFLNTTHGKSTYPAYVWPIPDPAIEETDQIFQFPEGSLLAGRDNVITVLQDNMGLNETNDWNADTSKSPRGIRGFGLVGGGNFDLWKVQGKLGGYTDFPDTTRGVLNEGGLYGERQGWHLPGFDDHSWITRRLSDGLPGSKAGVGFFRTEFNLDLPRGYDIHISFVFGDAKQPYRAWLFVNGWQMGKVVANLGPQYKFPVHEGILNYRGKNTVAVAIWALDNTAVTPSLSLAVDNVFEGGVGPLSVDSPRWKSRGVVP